MSGRGHRERPHRSVQRTVLDPTRLFQGLAKADVDYILVGGFAVNSHGVIRASNDLDICPNPDEDNLQRLATFLDSVGAVNVDEDEFEAGELAAHDLQGLKRGGNFRLRTSLGALDLMQYLDPFGDQTWRTLNERAEDRRVFGETVRVCSYDDLLKMKASAGRDQDRIDLNNLRAARREL